MSVKPRKSEFNKKGVAFGLELYNNVRAISKPTNTVLSPVSIHLALGLTYMGASGETQREMKRVLRLEDDKTLTGKSFYGVLCKYQKNPNIVIANKLYVQQGFEIKAEMNQAAKKWFKSEIEAVDFSEQASAAETVNKWIKEKTGGKITDIVNQDAFEPNTVLILLNALYFKCNWKHPFDMNTEEGHFWLNDGESMKVTMMKQRSMKASYAEFGDLDSIAVQLPFADEDLSMLILLPNNKTGLDALEAKLVGLDLPQRRKQMMQETVKITMPLFRVEFEQNLNDALKKVRKLKSLPSNMCCSSCKLGCWFPASYMQNHR